MEVTKTMSVKESCDEIQKQGCDESSQPCCTSTCAVAQQPIRRGLYEDGRRMRERQKPHFGSISIHLEIDGNRKKMPK